MNSPRRRKDDPPPEAGNEPTEPFVPPETPDPVPEPVGTPAEPEAIDSDFTPPAGTPDEKARKPTE